MNELWSPDPLADTEYSRLLAELREQHKIDPPDYEALRRWTVDHLSDFWLAVWRHFELPSTVPPTVGLADDRMPGARWFPEVRTNYAQAMLRLPGRAPSDVVVRSYSQTRSPVELTADGLRAAVGAARAGLERHGVRAGDRIAAYAPNVWETVVLLLAAASMGAVFTSCAPEFGVKSVIDRWSQIQPRLLFAADGYRYGQKEIDRADEVAQIVGALPSVETVVWLPYLHPDRGPMPGAVSWEELISKPAAPVFDPLPFDYPLYVLFSSGTTGLPKAIVHCHGGISVAHAESQGIQYDLGPRDTFLWFTTTGWMMFNYLISCLILGTTLVLFDGDPGFPDLSALWRLCEEAGVTSFGTSPSFLMSCRKAGLKPGADFDLSRIRAIGSTGSPLPEEGFRWVYDAVGTKLQLSSQSGGTDICSGFVGSSPVHPVIPGEIACRLLGVAAEAFDPDGRPLAGEVGELVVTRPTPSMPVGFWGDDGTRYREAYFDRYPGSWRQGDWVLFTERGSCVIMGRSDATLNRGGVRLGTAEFYSVVEDVPGVRDSLVVHLEGGDAGELRLFVVADGPWEEIRARISTALRKELSPRHVPDRIDRVPAIPRTLSGKKLEVPMKKILQGAKPHEVVTPDSLADPAALGSFLDAIGFSGASR